MADKLTSGDRFPSMALRLTGGEQIALPDNLSTPFTILLFDRGHW